MSRSNPVLRNIIANYASQIYVIVLGLAVVPLYLKYMGIEAYGLVGFFTMLQAWMTLFDFGFAPALGREASKFKAGEISDATLNLFLFVLERAFIFLGACLIFFCWVSGDWVASAWLKLSGASQQDASTSIAIVGVIFSFRLLSGLYRSALLGMENQVEANVVLVFATTLRSVFVLPILIWVSNSVIAFFTFQLFATIVETGFLKIVLRRSLPARQIEKMRWRALTELLRFSGGVAFLAWIWVATSQVDKLILSHLLPLKEYAEFILAATVAFGVYSLVTPLQQAILPRLVIFSVQNKCAEFASLYHLTTMLMVAVVTGVAGTIAAYPEQVMYAWTGERALAERVAEILRWYAAGTGFMAVAGMSYVLQAAKGSLGLHIKGNILSLLFLIPSLIVSTLHFGAVGAAMSWAVVNLFFLIFWTGIVHRKFLPELTIRWFFVDVAPGLCVAAALVLSAQITTWPFTSRSVSLVALILLALATTGIVLMIHHETRKLLFDQLSRLIVSVCRQNR